MIHIVTAISAWYPQLLDTVGEFPHLGLLYPLHLPQSFGWLNEIPISARFNSIYHAWFPHLLDDGKKNKGNLHIWGTQKMLKL